MVPHTFLESLHPSDIFVHSELSPQSNATGKTSILDVLSGRSAYDSGTITLDGEVVTDRVMKKLKKRVAYVKQSDLFFGHLTVRDQLTYTAFLRLPNAWPRPKKVAEVDRIIKQLRLTKCADTPIYRISGGERKRVNIGSELLTDPAIILLVSLEVCLCMLCFRGSDERWKSEPCFSHCTIRMSQLRVSVEVCLDMHALLS